MLSQRLSDFLILRDQESKGYGDYVKSNLSSLLVFTKRGQGTKLLLGRLTLFGKW
jgi:hypothetical protein